MPHHNCDFFLDLLCGLSSLPELGVTDGTMPYVPSVKERCPVKDPNHLHFLEIKFCVRSLPQELFFTSHPYRRHGIKFKSSQEEFLRHSLTARKAEGIVPNSAQLQERGKESYF